MGVCVGVAPSLEGVQAEKTGSVMKPQGAAVTPAGGCVLREYWHAVVILNIWSWRLPIGSAVPLLYFKEAVVLLRNSNFPLVGVIWKAPC